MSNRRNRQDLQRQQPEGDDEQFNFTDLAPLADKWIEKEKHVSDNQLEIAKLQYAAQQHHDTQAYQAQQHRDTKVVEDKEGARNIEKFRFRHFFWYVVGFSAVICIFAGGLIFVLHEIQAGILILSHFIALGSGVAAGLGIRPKRQPPANAKQAGS